MIAMQIHEDTRRICNMLEACSVGDVVTFDDMRREVNREKAYLRQLFYSAARITQREHKAIFASVRGVGYRRLHPSDLHKIGQASRSRIRNNARRGRKQIAAGLEGANHIEPQFLLKALSEQSVLGVLEHLSRDKCLPPMQNTDTRPMSIAETARGILAHFGGAQKVSNA